MWVDDHKKRESGPPHVISCHPKAKHEQKYGNMDRPLTETAWPSASGKRVTNILPSTIPRSCHCDLWRSFIMQQRKQFSNSSNFTSQQMSTSSYYCLFFSLWLVLFQTSLYCPLGCVGVWLSPDSQTPSLWWRSCILVSDWTFFSYFKYNIGSDLEMHFILLLFISSKNTSLECILWVHYCNVIGYVRDWGESISNLNIVWFKILTQTLTLSSRVVKVSTNNLQKNQS